MTAQVDLHRRREPAQGHDVAARDDKSGLGKIVLGGDSREDAVGQQIVQQDHRRRISTEHPVGESVDLVEGQLHEFLTLPANVLHYGRAPLLRASEYMQRLDPTSSFDETLAAKAVETLCCYP